MSAGFYCLNLIGCYIIRVETLGAIKQSNFATFLCLSSQDLDFSQLQSLSLLCVRVWDFPEVFFFVLLYVIGFYYWPLLFKILLTIENFENKLYKVDIHVHVIWLNFNFYETYFKKTQQFEIGLKCKLCYMNIYVVHIMHVVLYYIKLVKMTTYQMFKWIFIGNLYRCSSSLKTFKGTGGSMR